MPDLDLRTAHGHMRVFDFLHEARPLLLNLGEPGTVDVASWATRVAVIDAEYSGGWELPIVGVVDPPTAVLVRPDGYVAWVGTGSDASLLGALAAWFGPAGAR